MELSFLVDLEEQIRGFCSRWQVKELAIFGSALRSDYNADSDIDLLVTFSEETNWGLFDLVRMQAELESVFGIEVDLVERNAIENSENYIRREGILDGAQVIFKA